MRSTYKVAVERTAALPDIESIGNRFVAAEGRTGPSQLSVRDTARATIRAANAATQFTTSAPITPSSCIDKPASGVRNTAGPGSGDGADDIGERGHIGRAVHHLDRAT